MERGCSTCRKGFEYLSREGLEYLYRVLMKSGWNTRDRGWRTCTLWSKYLCRVVGVQERRVEYLWRVVGVHMGERDRSIHVERAAGVLVKSDLSTCREKSQSTY